MRFAYLIMAHNDLICLNYLLRLLDDSDNTIFLHIDTKWNIDIQKIYLTHNAKLYIYQVMDVRWGSFSQIECELFLFEQAIKTKFDYYHLLSGADLPLKKQSIIKKFFEKNREKEFIDFKWYEEANNKTDINNRVNLYHFFPFKKRKFNYYFNIFLTKIQEHIIKRNIQGNFYKGANWCSVTYKFARKLLEDKDWIFHTFSYGLCVDELYKQSIYMKYENEFQLYNKIPNDNHNNMRYIDWNRGQPYVWRKSDFYDLVKSEYIFARKFDSSVDSGVINMIFKYLTEA